MADTPTTSGTPPAKPYTSPPSPVTLTANEVAGLIKYVWGFPFDARMVIPTAPTEEELAQLVAIVLRESGGRTDARRDKANNPGGGNDKGLFQLNDKANTFDEADPKPFDAYFNAGYAVMMARHLRIGEMTPSGGIMPAWKAAGGLDLSPWGGDNKSNRPAIAGGYAGTHPLTPSAAVIAAAKAPADPHAKLTAAGHLKVAFTAAANGPTPMEQFVNKYGGTLPTVNTEWNLGPIDDIVSAVTDWATALGKLLGNLISGAWWRRVGIGALGVVLVIIAVVFAAGTPTIRKALA